VKFELQTSVYIYTTTAVVQSKIQHADWKTLMPMCISLQARHSVA